MDCCRSGLGCCNAPCPRSSNVVYARTCGRGKVSFADGSDQFLTLHDEQDIFGDVKDSTWSGFVPSISQG
eukprot:6264372-Amphidinium_carterae.1